MIRKDFFHSDSYEIELRNPEHIEAATNGTEAAETANKTLIEFCLPFTEIKHIVEGMVDEETSIKLEYPVSDNFLQILIPEESKGQHERLCQDTAVQLETYEAQHTLDADFSFKHIGIAA